MPGRFTGSCPNGHYPFHASVLSLPPYERVLVFGNNATKQKSQPDSPGLALFHFALFGSRKVAVDHSFRLWKIQGDTRL